MRLSPKQRRNISRILPFGGIWLVLSWIFMIYDITLTRYQNINPETDVTLTLPVLIFANFMITLTGLLVGTIEVVVLDKYFKRFSFGRKILYKFFLYLLFILAIITIAYPVAAALELQRSPISAEIISKLGRYFMSLTFLNTIIQLAFFILISLMYAAISEHIGHSVLINFFTGRYHRPKFERRIFMFLDMKNSTTIAEKLGHVAYFDFLKDYYKHMSDPIINHSGEVYQYIGDEVVITWKETKGFSNNNCLQVFKAIKQNIEKSRNRFEQKYAVIPAFRAGVHVGEVTIGEVGALKKEIVFTGDVLNTASRIQALGKEYNEDLIVSEMLKNGLESIDNSTLKELGELKLRGKSNPLKVYAVHVTD